MQGINASAFGGLDFAIGVVRGVRTWEVSEKGILNGIVYHQAWTPGENHALCRKSDVQAYSGLLVPGVGVAMMPTTETTETAFKPPSPGHLFNCQCGFYAYYDGSNDYYKGDYAEIRRMTGVVEGWGEVLVGTRGFRCTRARIVALYSSEIGRASCRERVSECV